MSEHRHLWEPADDGAGFVCPDCPATATACVVCQRVCEVGRTCDTCVSRARNDVREVRDLYRQLPDVIASIAGLHAVRYDRAGRGANSDTRLTGGEAMLLAAGGNADKTRLGRGEMSVDPSLIAMERADPPTVLGLLTFWEDAFRHEREESAAELTSVDDAVRYLVGVMEWAAQTSVQWDDYRSDLQGMLWRLRNLTGESRPKTRAEYAPCVHCGGVVVRDWTPKGLSDVRRCQQCGTTWPDEDRIRRIDTQVVHGLPTTHPDKLVTLDDAKTIYRGRVQAYRFDQWVARDALRPAVDEQGRPRRDEHGRLLYRLGTIDIQTGEATA